MTELVNRLRKQAACVYLAAEETVADDLSDGLKKAADEIEQLRRDLHAIKFALRSVDDQDWDFLLGQLGDGGRGRFWKTVVNELRPALAINGRDSR
jgi:hypothetical protein